MEEGAHHIAQHPLPTILVLWPLLCALFVRPLGRWREDVRNAFVAFATGVTLLGATALIPLVGAEQRIASSIPALIGRLNFTVDSYGMLFAVFAAFVWFAATLHSLDYMEHEHARDRYHTTSLVVLAAMLGVVLAGDLVTLYLFFEILGLTAFLFVIHTETDKAKQAAIKYFWMTVLGGFALIGGIFLTYTLGGDGTIGPIPMEQGTEVLRWVTFVLLLFGFGVKAGMLPVHVWLPDAHPVAPAPGSALLSGIMIKAGAYGIFRTVSAMFRPEVAEHVGEVLWQQTANFGLVVLWIGIATMFIGVTLALGQHNSKRMLAYHSVSQMGFILTGIGAAGYLGTEGAMGVAGGLLHVLNHALFKALLFLGVGAIVFRTGELDMYKLGGLWRKMPLTFVFMLIAAAGITGVPLFNGFVSKSLIHHALEGAHEVHHLLSLDIAEKIFTVTTGGTACSFIKLIGFTFLGKPKREYGPEVTDAPKRMLVAMGLMSIPIVVLGWRPQIVLHGVFAPGLQAWGLQPDLIDYYLTKYFLSPGDLMAVVVAFAIGAMIFVVGMKYGLFHLHPPKWFGVDYWYRRFAIGFVDTCVAIRTFYEAYLDAVSRSARRLRLRHKTGWAVAERRWRRAIITITTGAPGPRNQNFKRRAYIVLERERQTTVRYAVSMANEWMRTQPDFDAERRAATIVAVRDIASYMATRLFKQRMAVLEELIRSDEIEVLRDGFYYAVEQVKVFRSTVAHTAVELADRRLAGENVLREISARVNNILSEERFDTRLHDATATVHATLKTMQRMTAQAEDRFDSKIRETALGLYKAEERLERRLRDATEGLRTAAPKVQHLQMVARHEAEERLERRLREATAGLKATVPKVQHLQVEARESLPHTAMFAEIQVRGLGRLERAASWLYPDAPSVIATRRRIQRYARDMSFNLAVIVVVLLMFFLSIAFGMTQ